MLYDIFCKNNKKYNKLENKSIIIDIHEKNSLVPCELKSLGINIVFKSLKIGDYIVNNIIIERKTMNDFYSSMLSGRMDNQIENLNQFEKRLLIIEGDIIDLVDKKINKNIIYGKILSVLLKNNLPIIFTKDSSETAKYLQVLANKKEKNNSQIYKKRSTTIIERKSRVLESFPGIGRKTAKKLLEKYNTLENIFNSTEDELNKIIKSKSKNFMDILKS